jgi:uncharacterized tellurite resistance protein B-like protein
MQKIEKRPENLRLSVQKILDTAAKPNGYSKLTSQQRRLLLACVLAAVVPADGLVHDSETAQLQTHLQGRYGLQDSEIRAAIQFCRDEANRSLVQLAARHLVDLLSIDDRIALVGQLWDIALSDQDLHHTEESLVYDLADSFEVPRKHVIDQQARAARRNPIKS